MSLQTRLWPSIKRYPFNCFGILIPFEIALSLYGVWRVSGHFAIDFRNLDRIGLTLLASLVTAGILYFPLAHAMALFRGRNWAYIVSIFYGLAGVSSAFVLNATSPLAASPLIAILPAFGFYVMVQACRKVAESPQPRAQT